MRRGLIGARVRRPEELPLVRGEAVFVGDISLPGMVHVAFHRSPYAHAALGAVDCSAARGLGGVVEALSAADLDHVPGPIPVRLSPQPRLELYLQHALPREKVRYAGEIVALAVAEDRYLAEDAAELIRVEYEPLEPAIDTVEASRPGAPLLHEAAGSNVTMDYTVEFGDLDAAFHGAAVVVSGSFRTNRHAGSPIETRGLVAAYDDSRLTVWGPTKVLHANRRTLSELLGLPLESIRLVEPAVGGGFGVRGEVYAEDLLVPLLAMRLGRPVKWIEDRAEHLVAANHSREQHHEAALALDEDGRILGLRTRFLLDNGAYVRTHGIRVGQISAKSMVGPYRIPAYRAVVDQVVTNKTPAGTYRGPGRFETNFVRERLIDMGARRLGLDPAELRRRNLLTAADMPCEPGPRDWGEPIVYESGDPAAMLDRALEALRYEELRREQASAGRRLGIGMCSFMEDGGLGGLGTTPGEFARVVLERDGRATVYSGVTDLGQGFKTMLAQVCAEELELPFELVTVVHGDTDAVEAGGGTWASRGAILAGNATLLAAREAKAKRDGGEQLPVEASCTYTRPRMTFAPGAHAVAVEVDEETGVVTVLRQVIAYDVGRAINPAIVEAQIHGGLAQGIGGALLEQFSFDEETGQPLSASFVDYLLPTALEMAREQTVVVCEDARSLNNPLGVKAVGEVGPSSAGAAIGNAIADALADVDPDVCRPPFTPERVLGWLRGGSVGSTELEGSEVAALPAPERDP
jgi:CO/xanthine dehydrogenase Mo-binding subunit